MSKTAIHNLPQRKSIRLKGWDYQSAAFYFVTICTCQSQHTLGVIRNGQMHLSEEGKIVESIWHQIPNQFHNVILDSFVIMPNHIHGIIQIIENKSYKEIPPSTDAINRVRTGRDLKGRGGITGLKNPMLSQHNLGKIMRWYKGSCTYEIRKKCNPGFGWHSRFYDHIIRNESSLNYIRIYIDNNPKNWNNDCFLVR